MVNTPVELEVNAQEYVDVYRFKSHGGDRLGDPGWGVDPLKDKAYEYRDSNTEYAYYALILLAFLVVIRKGPIPRWQRILLAYLVKAANWLLKKLRREKKEFVVCSEFVYRIFDEATPPSQYTIKVGDIISLSALAAPAGLMGAPQKPADSFEKASQEFLRLYFQNKPQLSASAQAINPPSVTADFITPRNLERSRSVELIGRLRKN